MQTLICKQLKKFFKSKTYKWLEQKKQKHFFLKTRLTFDLIKQHISGKLGTLKT